MRNRKEKNERTALRYSIRIAGSVTSLSLRRNLVALWLTLNTENEITQIKDFNPGIKGSLNGKVLNFIYECLGQWKEHNAKGFSEFVSEMMIKDILTSRDFRKYKQVLDYL